MTLQDFYGNYFYRQEFIALVAIFLLGACLLFLGKRLEKTAMGALGFITGYYFFYEYVYHWFVQNIGQISLPIIAFSVIGGVVGLLIALFVRSVTIFLLGACLGYFICYFLVAARVLPNDILFWVISIILFTLLAHFIYDFFIILITSLIGSILVVFSAMTILNRLFTSIRFSGLLDHPLLTIIIIGALALMGIIEQKKSSKSKT